MLTTCVEHNSSTLKITKHSRETQEQLMNLLDSISNNENDCELDSKIEVLEEHKYSPPNFSHKGLNPLERNFKGNTVNHHSTF